jgi:HSP20 family protein
MIDVILKANPLNPEWYFLEDVQLSGSKNLNRRVALRSPAWRPPTDVYETSDAVIVRVEIAGMQEEDFTISLSGKFLVIRGVRPDVAERRAYHQMEIVFGEFMSEVELPCDVVAEEVRAEYSKGFLRLELPKIQPRKIKIED